MVSAQMDQGAQFTSVQWKRWYRVIRGKASLVRKKKKWRFTVGSSGFLMGVSVLLFLTPSLLYPPGLPLLTRFLTEWREQQQKNNTAISTVHQVKMNVSRESRRPCGESQELYHQKEGCQLAGASECRLSLVQASVSPPLVPQGCSFNSPRSSKSWA